MPSALADRVPQSCPLTTRETERETGRAFFCLVFPWDGREEEEHELERIDSDNVAPKMEDISSPIPLIIDYDLDLGCK